MIKISQYSFGKVIEGLSMAISFINENPLNSECHKDQLKSGEICIHCQCQSLMSELRELHRHLLPYKKNTIFTKTYWSLIATIEACDKLRIPWSIQDITNKENTIIKKRISITISRYALDAQGGHLGDESVTFTTIAFRRSKSNMSDGLAYLVDNWVINPDAFKISSKDLFKSEEPTAEMHKKSCEFANSNDFDNCDCLANVELYMASDEDGDDFWYSELDHALWNISNELPEATFENGVVMDSLPGTGGDRIWSIGNTECYNMDQFNSHEGYRKAIEYNNGLEANKW